MPSAPPALKALQRGLQAVFTDPRGARAAAAARPRALELIRSGGPCEPAARLSVYGDGYFLRMLEALAFDFPAVKRLAGEDAFRILVAHYLAEHPSISPSLADLGQAFPDFAASHQLAKRWPFLPDLARLERAVSECLLIDRLPPLSPDKLASLAGADWSRAQLVLDPSTRLLIARWPVLAYWRGGRRPSMRREQRLLVCRRDSGVSARALPAAEWRTLRRLQEGAPLGQALEASSQAAGTVRRWFSRWTAGGLIKDVRFD